MRIPSDRFSTAAELLARQAAPFLALCLAVIPALASAAEAEQSPPKAEDLIAQARERMDGYRTLRARIYESVAVSNRPFKAEGTYVQGPDNRLRLNLEYKIDGVEASMLQVCDGGLLWTTYEVGDRKRLLRRDVRQILDALAARPELAEVRMTEQLGLGGLPALLSAVDEAMTFDRVKKITRKDKDFFVLHATWSGPVADALVAKLGPREQWPPYVPDDLSLYLGVDDLFPYRIQYLKKRTDGADIPVLTIDLREIVWNASVDPDEFRFLVPADVDFEDQTAIYLQQLGQLQRAE